MLFTSDAAHKLIKKLEAEKKSLKSVMSANETFVVSTSEGDPELLRPEFDFEDTVKQISELDVKIMKIKHARNVFNTTTIVGDTGLTVDQVLMRLPILTGNAERYFAMSNGQPKRRVSSYGESVDYRYVNYDITYARELYEKASTELTELQEKLNLLNATATFEVDL